MSAHRSAGERGSVSPGRPRGRRRSSDEDGARDVDYRKHKLSKKAMMRTIMTMMTSEMAMIRIVTTAGVVSCEASLDGVRNTPDTRDAFLPVSLYYFRRR